MYIENLVCSQEIVEREGLVWLRTQVWWLYKSRPMPQLPSLKSLLCVLKPAYELSLVENTASSWVVGQKSRGAANLILA